jgi:CheY-like chemotaxis protein
MRIYLPRDRESGTEAMVATGAPAEDSPLDGAETILVVEDNEQMRQTAVAQLASLGYRVIEAEQGAAALAILEQRDRHVDLVFTDIVMPGKPDGYELARLALERRPGIKILLTSGFPGDTLSRNGKHAADLSLLGKPYRKDDLARAIRRALGSKPPKPAGMA